MNRNYHNPEPWFTFYEWQENRYNVGYFCSFGRLQPFISGNGSFKFGFLLFILGLCALLLSAYALAFSFSVPPTLQSLELYYNFSLSLLYTLAGIEMIYRNLAFTPKGPLIIEDPTYNYTPFLLVTHEST